MKEPFRSGASSGTRTSPTARTHPSIPSFTAHTWERLNPASQVNTCYCFYRPLFPEDAYCLGLTLSVARSKSESYQCDALSSMVQLTETNFKKMHTFRLEWQVWGLIITIAVVVQITVPTLDNVIVIRCSPERMAISIGIWTGNFASESNKLVGM